MTHRIGVVTGGHLIRALRRTMRADMTSASRLRLGRSLAIATTVVLTTGAPSDVVASPQVILGCAYAETITGTSGQMQHRERQEVIRLGDHLYQSWGGPAERWGENHCAASQCDVSGGVFELEANYRSREDGYKLRHLERRTVDLKTGEAASRTTDSTVQIVTGSEVETTIYGEGTCHPIALPYPPSGRRPQ